MNPRKIIAYLVLLVTYLVPFNIAYFTPPDTGKGSLMGFLFVVLGCVVFSILMFKEEIKEERSGSGGH